MTLGKFVLATLLLFGYHIAEIFGQSEYQFLPLETDLSQGTVTAVLEDHRGFLWIGTRSGLNRFDGTQLQTYYYDHDDSTSISDNYIRTIYETRSGDLWIGSDAGGLCKYQPDNDNFERYNANKDRNLISSEAINVIYEDRNEGLWIGTQKSGLYHWRIDGAVEKFSSSFSRGHEISDDHITGITEDRNAVLWIATRNGGLNFFDDNRFQSLNSLSGYSSHPLEQIRCLERGKGGELIVGTQGGLFTISIDLNPKNYVVRKVPLAYDDREPVVLSVLEDSNGRTWIGSENQGVYVNDVNGGWRHFDSDTASPYRIENNSIWSLYEDRAKRIWLGTYSSGLYKIDNQIKKFDSYTYDQMNPESIGQGAVSSFAIQDDNNVWIGTDGGGLNLWNINSDQFRRFNKSNGFNLPDQILSLYLDNQQNIWVGTWNSGLFLKRKNKSNFSPVELILRNAGLQDLDVMSIAQDSTGSIWLAANDYGLLYVNSKTFECKSYSDDLPGKVLVRVITVNPEGGLWVGTEDHGLFHLNIENGSYKLENKLIASQVRGGTIQSLFDTGTGVVYIGTTRGLFQWNISENVVAHFGRKAGLLDETIYAIMNDVDQSLWVSTNQGLSQLDMKSEIIRNYRPKDGLQGLEYFKNAALKLRNGHLLFGGVNGFNYFDPSAFKLGSEARHAYLDKLEVAHPDRNINEKVNISLLSIKEVNLDFYQNDLTIKYGELNLSPSGTVEFAYRLENFDEDWHYAEDRREAIYLNVPSGSYKFLVRAKSENGQWQIDPAELNIIIARAWYVTNLAISLYSLLVLLLLLFVIRSIANRVRLTNKIKLERLERNKAEEITEIKTNFFTNISHELRSPLTLIQGPLKNLLGAPELNEKQHRSVGLMIKNANRLLRLINELLDLSKMESGQVNLQVARYDLLQLIKSMISMHSELAGQKFISIKVDLPENPVWLFYDETKIEKVLSNLLSNALKYTPEFGSVKCSVIEHSSLVELVISDSGQGIPKDELPHVFDRYYRVIGEGDQRKTAGTGIGLALTRELVKAHDAKISVSSRRNEGAVFTIKFKKGKEHFEKNEFKSLQKVVENKKEALPELVVDERNNDLEIDKENSSPDISSASILVIEDNDEIREFVIGLLASDYKVTEATNGQDGIEEAQSQLPDLVISDVMMERLDGYEVCRQLKEDARTATIPVVLLTARSSEDSEREGYQHGADYYIRKPFDPDTFLLQIQNVLAHSKRLRTASGGHIQVPAGPSNVKLDSKDDVLVKKAIRIIEEHMSDSQFHVDVLARELGYSRMQLYRKLKAILGVSANEFIRNIRLKRAAQLIGQNQLSIAEVTYEVGFNDLQYFRDCFKKEFGVTPSEYGENQRHVN